MKQYRAAYRGQWYDVQDVFANSVALEPTPVSLRQPGAPKSELAMILSSGYELFERDDNGVVWRIR